MTAEPPRTLTRVTHVAMLLNAVLRPASRRSSCSSSCRGGCAGIDYLSSREANALAPVVPEAAFLAIYALFALTARRGGGARS